MTDGVTWSWRAEPHGHVEHRNECPGKLLKSRRGRWTPICVCDVTADFLLQTVTQHESDVRTDFMLVPSCISDLFQQFRLLEIIVSYD
jgi:hypothetical protein